MSEKALTLTFPGITPDEANRRSQELAAFLKDVDGLRAERVRERQDSLDFGTSLVLVLGTTSLTALARGLAAYLRRTSGVTIRMTSGERHITATGLNSPDAARIATVFFDDKPA